MQTVTASIEYPGAANHIILNIILKMVLEKLCDYHLIENIPFLAKIRTFCEIELSSKRVYHISVMTYVRLFNHIHFIYM